MGDEGIDAIDVSRSALSDARLGGPSAAAALLDASGRAQCSGVLIARDVVLSAGHCAALGATSVAFGDDAIAPAERIAITKVTTHPRFDAETLVHDVAVFVLERPASVAPARTRASREVVSLRPGMHLEIVGFGRLPEDGPSRRKRQGRVRVEASAGDDAVRVSPDPARPCTGDSGGPAFDEEGFVVGVMSRGDLACLGTAFVAVVAAPDLAFSEVESARGGCDRR